MKKHAALMAAGLLVVLFFVCHAARIYTLPFFEQLENALYDYRILATMPGKQDPRVVILDIDERSLAEEGRWPWSRDRLALLIDKLFDQYGVAVVGFDIVFAEQDDSSGLSVLQDLARQRLKEDAAYRQALDEISPSLDYDRRFADSLQGRKVVMGYYFSMSGTTPAVGALPLPVFTQGAFPGAVSQAAPWQSYGANLPLLQAGAGSAGHFNQLTDFDGEVRRVPVLAEYQGNYYESLSLAVVRTLFDQPVLKPGLVQGDFGALEWLEFQAQGRPYRIPLDENIAALVPFRGRQGSYRYLSVTDVLHDRVASADLKGKIVLVGTTTPGLLDLRSTPVGELYPGVELHANLVSGILDQSIKSKPGYIVGAEAVWLLLTGGLLAVLVPLLTPLRAMLTTLFILALTQGLSLGLWYWGNTLFPVANSLLMVAALFALDMSYGYFVESRVKHQITNLFGQYVPTELVQEMVQHPESVSMAGESRELTVLFSDVRNFTSISETLDPKALTELMNEFLTPLSRIVYKHRGTIDKYMGDCIMAFWGAPLPDANHARNALLAGMEMQAAMHAMADRLKARGWPELRIGVGINSGRVSVGNMGSEVRVAYTVMGDEVNLASRLEGLTKAYQVGIIVGENTRKLVKDMTFRELDHVRVKGKATPVAIYEPLGMTSALERAEIEEVKLFHELRRYYLAQNWDQAELQLMNLQHLMPDCGLYAVYAERIAYYRQHPPGEDWDGVFVFKGGFKDEVQF